MQTTTDIEHSKYMQGPERTALVREEIKKLLNPSR